MNRTLAVIFSFATLAIACVALAQTSPTQSDAAPAAPTTRPVAATMPADQLLQQMLRPAGGPAAKPLTPVENLPTFDQTAGKIVAPAQPAPPLMREGDFVRDRVGRLQRGA